MVFDCSARTDGKCLNDQSLHGPDSMNNLVAVLLCFRQYPFVVVGDIKSMFSQFLIAKKDRDALRFCGLRSTTWTVKYRMRSHVFGAKSSPCCAAYALRKVASDNEIDSDVDAIQTIRSNIYVDDLCKTCPTEQDAFELVTQLRQLLLAEGFGSPSFFLVRKYLVECSA